MTSTRGNPQSGILVLGRLDAVAFKTYVDLLEALRYDVLWHADERFFRDCWIGLATAAARTERIKLGACVVDPYTRHPALHAVSIASLQEVSSGRALLGIGAGIAGFSELEIDLHKPLTRVRESILLIRQLLAGAEVNFEGEFIRFRHGRLQTPPAPDIPIMIATNGMKMMELAGEMADAVMVQALGSTQMLEWVHERLSAGAVRAGRRREEVEVIARLDTCIDDDRDKARTAVKTPLVRHLRVHYPHFHSQQMAGLSVPDALRDALGSFSYGHEVAGSKEAERLIPDLFVDRLCLAGTVDETAGKAADLFRHGVDQLTIFPVSADGTADGQLQTVRMFGAEVMPRVRQLLQQESS